MPFKIKRKFVTIATNLNTVLIVSFSRILVATLIMQDSINLFTLQ